MSDVEMGALKIDSFLHPETGKRIWYVSRLTGKVELFPGYVSDAWALEKSGFGSKAAATKWIKANSK